MQNIFSACETIRFFTEIVTPKNDLHNFPLVCIMHLRFLVSLKKIWKKIFFTYFTCMYSNRQKCNFHVKKFSIIDKNFTCGCSTTLQTVIRICNAKIILAKTALTKVTQVIFTD